MRRAAVDLPSLAMALCFTANLMVCFLDRMRLPASEQLGRALLVLGVLLFGYVLLYLRRGFLGETRPNLDHLVTGGPYRFCRHPLYLSFIIIVLGIDLMLRSPAGLLFTFAASLPSAVYRGRVEDRLLREKFGEEWERYAREVGFLLPKKLPGLRPRPKTRTLLLSLALFLPLGLAMDVLHELGHALSGIAAGGTLRCMKIAYLEVYPQLAVTTGFTLGYIEVTGLPTSFAQGLFLLSGSLTTHIVSWLLVVILLRTRLRPEAQVALRVLALFGLLDLPFYVLFPQVGLPHWILIGGNVPEPMLGARKMGLPDLVFYVIVTLTSLGLVFLYSRPFRTVLRRRP